MPPPLVGSIRENGTAQLAACWALDFFGKNRAALDAALGSANAAEADTQAASVLLASVRAICWNLAASKGRRPGDTIADFLGRPAGSLRRRPLPKALTTLPCSATKGLGNYLSVLTAETSVLVQRRLAVDLAGRARHMQVALIRALGGYAPRPVPAM